MPPLVGQAHDDAPAVGRVARAGDGALALEVVEHGRDARRAQVEQRAQLAGRAAVRPGVEAAEQAHLALREDLAEVLAARVVEDHRAHLFARDLFKEIHRISLRFSGRGRVENGYFANTVSFYH